MKKINKTILSIPPYISTSWSNVGYVQVEDEPSGSQAVIIGLENGSCVRIPDVDKQTIERIFAGHAAYLELQVPSKESPNKTILGGALPISIDLIPSQLGIDNISDLQNILEHNPSYANGPDLPPEMLEKIATITKMIGMDTKTFQILSSEPHCNCPYCQVARAISPGVGEKQLVEEESVTEEDLHFRDWDIKQKDDYLFEVYHPLDQQEMYQVYLGDPIGCTCGKNNCEHIRAVLLHS